MSLLRRCGPVLALAVPVALLVAACSSSGPDVTVATVGLGTVSEVVEAPGTVTARATATLNAPADARVVQIAVRDGQAVRAGHVVLRLDSPTARANLRQAQQADRDAAASGSVRLPGVGLTSQQRAADRAAATGFAQARAAAAQIPDPAARAQALAGITSAEGQYAAARDAAADAVRRFNSGLGSLASALSSLSSAQRVQTKAAVALAQRTVDALVVVTPIAGTVSLGGTASSGSTGLPGALSSLPADLQSQAGALLGGSSGGSSVRGSLAVGQPVSSGQPIATVTDTSTLGLTAEVDETDVLLVRAGVLGSADLDAVPDANYEVRVRAVDLSPTQSSRGGVSYVVRLDLGKGTDAQGGAAPTPRPGMSAVIDLRVRTATGVVAVPAAAVFRDGRRDAVWVVRSGKVVLRPVRLGAQGEDRIQVTEGLQTGERVIVRGADRVRAGQSIGS